MANYFKIKCGAVEHHFFCFLQTVGIISEEEECDVRYLRDFVKLRTLTAEQQNTEESLQTLKYVKVLLVAEYLVFCWVFFTLKT